MSTPEKCPKCGDPLKDGWDNVYQCGSAFYTEGPLSGRIREHYECIRLQRDQLAANLSTLESAYAECTEKLHRAEQREHDFKRRLADVTKQRDRLEQRVSELELRAQGRDESRDIIIDAELAGLRGFVERMENKP